jgi:hypothetical protein
MILQDLLPFLGCSELDPGFLRLMSEAGVALDDLSKTALRDQSVIGIELHDQGLALTLNERGDHIAPTRSRGIKAKRSSLPCLPMARAAVGLAPMPGQYLSASNPSQTGPLRCARSARPLRAKTMTVSATGTSGSRRGCRFGPPIAAMVL